MAAINPDTLERAAAVLHLVVPDQDRVLGLPQRVAIYCRISKDDGTALGVARQKQDCVAHCLKIGWVVVQVFTDNDKSASGDVVRPDYDRMMTGCKTGRYDGLVAWDVDRLTRHPRQLEDIIDLYDKHGVQLASVGGEIDLSTPQGKLTARIKGSVARHEYEQIQRRIKRQRIELAEKGMPNSRLGFGWGVVQEDGVRRGIYRNLTEAPVVEEIVRRVLGGEGCLTIANDLNRRGILTANGNQWGHITLRKVAMRPVNAGLRVYHKEVIGKGAWEPIISDEDHARVVAVLADPGRRTAFSNRHRYLMPGIALCGVCGSPVRIYSCHSGRSKTYVCKRGQHVRRSQSKVDELIEKLIRGFLARPDISNFLTATDTSSFADDAVALRAELDEISDMFDKREITARQVARMSATIIANLQEVESRLSMMVSPSLSFLADPAFDWDQATVEVKRHVIDSLFCIAILPTAYRGHIFDPDSVVVEWRPKV